MNVLERTHLIDMNDSHLKLVFAWRNQSFIRDVMYDDMPIAYEEHKRWFKGIKDTPTKIVKIFYLDEQPLGLIQFKIDKKNNKCEWGFYIGESKAPKGIGKVMGILALDLAFTHIKVRKLCGEVLAINPKSIHYHEKFGFQREGTLKKHILKGNQYIDVLLFSLFSTEWGKKRESMIKKVEGLIV